MRSIGVTGASGFVGQRLIQTNSIKYNLVPLDLRKNKPQDTNLEGIESIIHLAGMAHRMTPAPESEYIHANFELAKTLAEHAKAAGVRQFIYISSSKIFGDRPGRELSEMDNGAPDDAYGKSKWQAEEFLRKFGSADFNIAVIRPPLIYGPGVKGNMLRLLELVHSGKPLPFKKIDNLRSMVFVDNLIALITHIIDRQSAGTFHAGDAEILSTSQIIKLIQEGLNTKSLEFGVPQFARKFLKVVKPPLYERLFGSFVLKTTQTCKSLGFSPPHSASAGFREMTRWFLSIKDESNGTSI